MQVDKSAWVVRVVSWCVWLALAGCGGGGGGADATATVPTSPAATVPATGTATVPVTPTETVPVAVTPTTTPTVVPSNTSTLTTTATPKLSLLVGSIGGPGNLDGIGAGARFYGIQALVADAAGNLYVTEAGNQGLRKVTPAGMVSTLAKGAAVTSPGYSGLTIDKVGNLYVADTAQNVIRKITPDGEVNLLAGSPYGRCSLVDSGNPLDARFCAPRGIAVDTGGNLYVADSSNNAIRRITPAGAVSTIATMTYPTALAFDSAGSLYSGSLNDTPMMKITTAGVISTVNIINVSALSTDRSGNVWASSFSSTSAGITQISPAGVATLYSNLPYNNSPLVFDTTGNVYAVGIGGNTIVKYDALGTQTTVAGLAATGSVPSGLGLLGFTSGSQQAMDNAGNLYLWAVEDPVRYPRARLYQVTAAGSVSPFGNAYDSDGKVVVDRQNNVYITSFTVTPGCSIFGTGSCPVYGLIYRVPPVGNPILVAGSVGDATMVNSPSADGLGNKARFPQLTCMTSDTSGNLYAVGVDFSLRKITPSGSVSTLAALPSISAQFNAGCKGMVIDNDGNFYIAQPATVHKVTPSGVTAVVTGKTSDLGNAFGGISSIALDIQGNLYVADQSSHTVRKYTTSGVNSTVAGTDGSRGIRLGAAPSSLDSPNGLVFDTQGTLYMLSSNAILKLQPAAP